MTPSSPLRALLGAAAALSLASAAASASAADVLPPGKAHDLVTRTCSACHGLAVVTSQRHDADGWDQIVGVMVQRGAKATDSEQDQIVDYLAANFGTKPAAGAKSAKATTLGKAAYHSALSARPH